MWRTCEQIGERTSDATDEKKRGKRRYQAKQESEPSSSHCLYGDSTVCAIVLMFGDG